MAFDADELSKLDFPGYTVVEAITHGGLPTSATHARPTAFVCLDGKTYWLKAKAQQGLVAELIAGRLAVRCQAGPLARIVRVTKEAVESVPDADHLQGVVVGIEDIKGAVNARDLKPFKISGEFQPEMLDAASRARVIAFQTWIGVQDNQVLIQLANGFIHSIDHGDAFGDTSADTDPSIVVTKIPDVPDDLGKGTEDVSAAVDRIEAITDGALLQDVANVPGGEDPWRSPADRRLRIAEWLAFRRGRLREVMETWLKT